MGSDIWSAGLKLLSYESDEREAGQHKVTMRERVKESEKESPIPMYIRAQGKGLVAKQEVKSVRDKWDRGKESLRGVIYTEPGRGKKNPRATRPERTRKSSKGS